MYERRQKIALVSPSGTFTESRLSAAMIRAAELGFDVVKTTNVRLGRPAFLNGSRVERLHELEIADKLPVDGVWCARGGCGAIDLWPFYQTSHLETTSQAPLIGYSDITIYHLQRYIRNARIGIHGPVFLELTEDSSHIEALTLLINKQAERLIYPALTLRNHSLLSRVMGELIPMNLSSLQCVIGCSDSDIFRGKILALEDVNEPHYKVFRMMQQLKNSRMLAGVKALIIGYFGDDRQAIIDDTMIPLANEEGIPLFDWPIFGHQQPNWPLLFGAMASIRKIGDTFFTLAYHEQHDHSVIHHDNFTC